VICAAKCHFAIALFTRTESFIWD